MMQNLLGPGNIESGSQKTGGGKVVKSNNSGKIEITEPSTLTFRSLTNKEQGGGNNYREQPLSDKGGQLGRRSSSRKRGIKKS